MLFSVITIFPEMICGNLQFGLLEKAIFRGTISVDVYNLRDFALDKHKKVDDRPFGGGPGMVLKPEPLTRAVEFIKEKNPGYVILFSASGKILNQQKVRELAGKEHLILVCGRYEGVDQRFIDACVDEELAIGEYVLMGGELAAAVMIEAVSRMIPGVVGNFSSIIQDSFSYPEELGFPQYTQPREFRKMVVPEELLSGDHARIEEWRRLNRKRRK